MTNCRDAPKPTRISKPLLFRTRTRNDKIKTHLWNRIDSSKAEGLPGRHETEPDALHENARHDSIRLPSGEPNRHVQRLLASGSSTRGKGGHITGKKTRRFSPPSRPEIVDMLEDHKMLPAIVFIFSRAQCEDAVLSCMRAGIVLTSMDEEAQIRDLSLIHI